MGRIDTPLCKLCRQAGTWSHNLSRIYMRSPRGGFKAFGWICRDGHLTLDPRVLRPETFSRLDV